MQTIHSFISQLRELGIKIWAEGEQLRIKAPKGTLTSEIREQLTEQKSELLHFLRTANLATQTPQQDVIPKVSREGSIPLSFAQERLWFLDQLEEHNSAYNMPIALRITGQIDLMVLERSFNEIIRRHEVLRTTFKVLVGEPIQHIHSDLSISFTPEDLRTLPEDRREDELKRVLLEDAETPFDLTQCQLFRVALYQMQKEEYVLLITIHHIIFDGWSGAVFVQELVTLYEAFLNGKPSPLTELPFQYADFASWQRKTLQGDALEQQLSYWKNELSGELPVLNLATDYPRPAQQTIHGAEAHFTLSQSVASQLAEFGKQEGVSLFMILFAAFNTLLYRYTSQEDILVGVPIANRNKAALESLIGFFVNTLVLRTDLSGNPPFQHLLKQVREKTLGAQQYQDMPLEYLVSALRITRDLDRQPLFQVMFVLQNAPTRELTLSDVTFAPLALHNNTAKFDLTLEIRERENDLIGNFEYNTDLFEPATIHRMVGHFQTLIEGIVRQPTSRLSDLPLLTDAERHQLLIEWNETQVAYPKDTCVHELFEAQAALTPENVAAVFLNVSLTYHELNTKANQLAHYLRTLGVGPETLVGICLKRSLNMIVTILGILKAGGAYVPLDPSYPASRLAFMLEDTQASVLLTQQELKAHFPEYSGQVICLDTEWDGTIGLESGKNPECITTSKHLAYLIFTSGSTGKPKGTMIPHQGVVNYLSWATHYYMVAEGDGAPINTPIGFDATVTSLFSPLLTGRQIVFIPEEDEIEAFIQLLRTKRNFSLVKITPAYLAALGYSLSVDEAADRTRAFVIGGEALLPEHVAYWRQHAPATRLINEYGPTETVVGCCVYDVPQDRAISGSIPIGKPIANTQLYILDAYGQPVPIGVPGELYIGGDGVGRGYLNRPKLTQEKFIPSPFRDNPESRLYKTGDLARYLSDGNIEFLGRTDQQVKVRGFRIELGEIEAILSRHPAIQESIVTVHEDKHKDKRLVVYLVLSSEHAPTIHELRTFLHDHVPEYMIPSFFVYLERLPLTPNGKVDRRALPAPDHQQSCSPDRLEGPRNTSEKRLADIWTALLDLQQVGIHQNFFEIGGHSLLVAQLIARIRNEFQLDVPVQAIFKTPTIAGLSESIRSRLSEDNLAEGIGSDVVDLEAEVILDSTIIPKEGRPHDTTNPARIFLTGATGFLGAFLVHELLHQTQAEVLCLVRSANQQEGNRRLRQILDSYGLWDEQVASRLIAVSGDLAHPLLGLSSEQFGELADKIDLIYHNGAFVNFIYPYSALKPANVLGTQEVLRLACEGGNTPVQYVSTLSVFLSDAYSGKDVIDEDEPLVYDLSLQGGYAQSKWVAERLVALARARGLPVTIYRPGQVSGHSQTGVSQTTDFALRMLKACLQFGMVPDQFDQSIDVVPVDYVAQAIVALSSQPESQGQIFHLVNPNPMNWADFVNWMQTLGYPLQAISYAQWKNTILHAVTDKDALAPFLPLLQENHDDLHAQKPPRFNCGKTLKGLVGTSIACPPVNADLLQTYFSYFIRSGFLTIPEEEKL